jgi:uncharacterized membrane protein
MRGYIPCLSAIALLSSLLSLAVHGKNSACYGLTRINQGDEENFFVADMNDKGEVVGGSEFRAFLWRDGQFVDLPPPFDGSFPGIAALAAINNRSDILGQYEDAQFQSHVVVLVKGKVIEVRGPAGITNFSPVDMNDHREVLTVSFSPFIWERGETILLERVPNDQVDLVIAINDRGRATGTNGSTGASFAVLWERDGSVMQLPRPEGADAAIAGDINNRGQVVADAFFRNVFPGVRRPYIWDEGEITVLGLPYPSDTDGAAFTMNNRGSVVGLTFDRNDLFTTGVATLWRRGNAFDLNTLICSDDTLKPFVRLRLAREINDHGEIVAVGTDAREPERSPHYFLTPKR